MRISVAGTMAFIIDLTMTQRNLWRVLGAAAVTSALMASAAAQSDPSVERFYKGNQIKLYSSAGPGSGYSVWARFIGQHLGRHVPGEPSVVVQYMPGAGGIIAANYMYTVAPKDGREIASLAREAPSNALMGGGAIRYDPLKFNWLGTPTSESNICIAAANSPFHTLDDLYKHDLVVGTDGVGSGMHIFPVALNALLKTKFKVIDGYSDSAEVLLAIDRGEIHGTCQSAETLFRARGDAIRSGKLRVVLHGGLKPNPKFSDVPFVLDLASTDEQKQALKFLYSSLTFGRPYVAPPGVPPERVAALRKAYMDMFRDKGFLADAEKQGYEINPISGEEMTSLIAELAKTPKHIIDQVAALIDPQKK
jgi:tripartite-type tricarboxylate transporter receptor subunit TctC